MYTADTCSGQRTLWWFLYLRLYLMPHAEVVIIVGCLLQESLGVFPSMPAVLSETGLHRATFELASVIHYIQRTVCKAILLIYKSHTYSYWIIIFFVWAVFHFETNLASEHNKGKGTCCAPVLFLEHNKGGTFVNYCGFLYTTMHFNCWAK